MGEAMVSFTRNEGSEPVISPKSPDPESTSDVLKGSAPGNSHIPTENNGSSEIVSGQPKAIDLRELPSSIPGHTPVLVNEKQYEAILRLRSKRAKARCKPKFKKHRPRGPTGRFVAMGNQGMTSSGISLAPSSNPAVDFYGALTSTNEDMEHVGEAAYLAMGNQGMINPGISQEPSNIPAVDFFGPFVATNGDEEHVVDHEAAYLAMCYQALANPDISYAPSSVPEVDFYGFFVATNEDEEHVGEAAYLAVDSQGMINPCISQAPSNIPAASLEMLLGADAYTALCYQILAIPFNSDAPSIIYWPFEATNDYEEHVGESADVAMGNQGMTNAGISHAPSGIPEADFYGPFVATNEDEEHVGEAAYNSILNLESPDCTALLRIMMGDKYTTDVMEEFRKLACQESPDFTTLLSAMNNMSYDEATDEGYYSVEKVLLKLGGWL